jgi:H+/Cl- antiporter ClcA
MRSVALVVGLIALLFADIWGAATVFNAVFRSGGTSGLFWVAVVIIAGLLALSLWLTGKVARRLRHRDIATRF